MLIVVNEKEREKRPAEIESNVPPRLGSGEATDRDYSTLPHDTVPSLYRGLNKNLRPLYDSFLCLDQLQRYPGIRQVINQLTK